VIYKTFVVMLEVNFLFDSCIVKSSGCYCAVIEALEWLDCHVELIFQW
jgi:hypothetical protein